MTEFLEQALKEIEDQGFKVIEASKPWRYVRGTATTGGQTYFFKISPPEGELPKRLQKQEVFEKFMSSKLKETFSPPFRVPQPILSNFTPESSWIIDEFFSGDLLASWTPKREPRNLANWLDKIAEALIFMDSLDTQSIHLAYDDIHETTINERMVKFMGIWGEKPLEQKLLTEGEIAQLVKIISDSPPLPTRLQHGDFVPWHMIDLGEVFGLIDSESASIAKARFYDLAYFYHRVFTKLLEPDIARQFLRTFMKKSNLNKEEIAVSLLPILASRAIGGMYDYTNTDHVHDDTSKTVLSLHQDFLQLVLKQNLSTLL